MNRRVTSLGALVGALVLIVAACTPPPGAAMVDRINFWDVDGERLYMLLVLAPAPPSPSYPAPPTGSIENTSTSSTAVLEGEVFYQQFRSVLAVSCVGPQTRVGLGLSCAAEGTSVATVDGKPLVSDSVSGTLTTSGPPGSVTAFLDLTSSGPYGESRMVGSFYDGLPSAP